MNRWTPIFPAGESQVAIHIPFQIFDPRILGKHHGIDLDEQTDFRAGFDDASNAHTPEPYALSSANAIPRETVDSCSTILLWPRSERLSDTSAQMTALGNCTSDRFVPPPNLRICWQLITRLTAIACRYKKISLALAAAAA